MVVFPNAKINIGLNIISKRADGFHSLESIFYPVPWNDILEIIPAEKFEFSMSGIQIQGDPEENLCVKVYRSLQQSLNLPPVCIHLHKLIPVGAGLGGGSADAAFTAKLLNEMFHLGMSDAELMQFIKVFGSDCAFFINNQPAFAMERGDVFEESSITLKGKFLVMVYPDLFISTKEAYGGIKPEKPEHELRLVLKGEIQSWKQEVRNDFETTLFPKYPVLQQIKKLLYDAGAQYASMSGSGSTIFGIFENEVDVRKSFPGNYSIIQKFLEM